MAADQVDKIYTCDMFHLSSKLFERHAAKNGRPICTNIAERSQKQTLLRAMEKPLAEIATCEDD
jgi:hypothetical protein